METKKIIIPGQQNLMFIRHNTIYDGYGNKNYHFTRCTYNLKLDQWYVDAIVEGPEHISDPCPDCGTQLEAQWRGGVKCPAKDCGYWFCF